MRAGRSSTLKLSMARAPDFPANSRDQVSATPQASGLTIPIPVMTTRRMILKQTSRGTVQWYGVPGLLPSLAYLALRFFDELHGVAHGHNGFRGVVRDFNSKFFFKRHNQL